MIEVPALNNTDQSLLFSWNLKVSGWGTGPGPSGLCCVVTCLYLLRFLYILNS